MLRLVYNLVDCVGGEVILPGISINFSEVPLLGGQAENNCLEVVRMSGTLMLKINSYLTSVWWNRGDLNATLPKKTFSCINRKTLASCRRDTEACVVAAELSPDYFLPKYDVQCSC